MRLVNRPYMCAEIWAGQADLAGERLVERVEKVQALRREELFR